MATINEIMDNVRTINEDSCALVHKYTEIQFPLVKVMKVDRTGWNSPTSHTVPVPEFLCQPFHYSVAVQQSLCIPLW